MDWQLPSRASALRLSFASARSPAPTGSIGRPHRCLAVAGAIDLPAPSRGLGCAVSSAVEHCFHTAGATGSIPVPRTIKSKTYAIPGPAPMAVVTRFAPSPTGMLHVGGVRTALFSWLYARRMGGKFILRIEDTDRERSTDEAVRVILDGMKWCSLDADEGPYYQTQRADRYKEVIRGMLDDGNAYHCYCTKQELDAMREQQIARKEKPRYSGICRDRKEPRPGVDPVVRFRNPLDGAALVNDLVHGQVTFQNKELDDLIIARSDGTPTYNFCVVVDDMDMGVTHVIRGDDHLNNTPRQKNKQHKHKTPKPKKTHKPKKHDPKNTKHSKRHGAVSVLQYEEE